MSDPISLALQSPRFIKRGIRLAPIRREPEQPFQWPLGCLGRREPLVLAEHTGERHGVDLGYTPAVYDPDLSVPVHAVNDGEIAMSLPGADGHTITIDHGQWMTVYAHLSRSLVTACMPRLRRRERVRAGRVIGHAARSPLHLRFELWRWTDARGFVAVAPAPCMQSWIGASTQSHARKVA